MDVGKFRHRIYFRNPHQGRNPKNGDPIKTWVDSAEYWAHVEYSEIGSGERMINNKLTPLTAADITLRYFQGITTEMEVVFNGLIYKILSVLPDEKKCYVKLETQQVGALRDQGLSDDDGMVLQDNNGNALVIGDGDIVGNYQAPNLTFVTDSNEEFNPNG